VAQVNQLNELLEPVVESMQYEFVGLEYLSGAKPAILRIYIDHEDGISVDDCAAVSRQVSAVLDVEDPIAGEYNLEVSSPGLNRPLFKADHYAKSVGERVKLQTRYHIDGRRKFTGTVLSADEDQLELEIDNTQVTLSMNDIEKGQLIFDHGRK
jgi:ribosome maturation factor RimP